MGMPISLALRGRHADDAAAGAAWADGDRRAPRGRPGLQHLPRRTPASPGSAAARSTWPTALPRWPRCSRSAGAPRRSRGGAFDVRRPTADGPVVLDPSGVVKGWAVERAAAHLRTLDDTDFCLSAGGDMVCRTADPDGTPWRIGIEDPLDPSRVLAVVPVASAAPSRPRGRPTGARTWSTPARVAAPRRSRRSRWSHRPSPGPTSTPPRHMPWTGTLRRGCAHVPGVPASWCGATARSS